MPVSRWIFRTVGLFPIRDHYYEPLFHAGQLRHALDRDRTLPGIDLNDTAAMQEMEDLSHAERMK